MLTQQCPRQCLQSRPRCLKTLWRWPRTIVGRLILKIYKMDFPLRTKAPCWAQHVCEDCPVLGFLTGVEAFFPQWLIVHIQNSQSSNSKWQVLLSTWEGTFLTALPTVCFSSLLWVLVILTIEHHQDNAMILQRGRMTVSLLLFKNVLQYVVRLALLNSGREISSHGVTLYNKEHLHLGNTLIHRCSVLSLLPFGSVPESLLTEKIRLCLE